MSALDHKRTFAPQKVMSALSPKVALRHRTTVAISILKFVEALKPGALRRRA
jgi:hypothetical protein